MLLPGFELWSLELLPAEPDMPVELPVVPEEPDAPLEPLVSVEELPAAPDELPEAPEELVSDFELDEEPLAPDEPELITSSLRTCRFSPEPL